MNRMDIPVPGGLFYLKNDFLRAFRCVSLSATNFISFRMQRLRSLFAPIPEHNENVVNVNSFIVIDLIASFLTAALFCTIYTASGP